ncbi:MAG: Flp family type IVb pilin [Alphaproteobacteria bacterium]
MRRLAKLIAITLELTSNRAVTALEYGLILALIALAIITALNFTSGSLTATFNTVAGFFGNVSQ